MVETKIAIIPARGGSKRIPKKNIKLFKGKPMIVWTIEAAIKANVFDRVVVSTDDKEIAEIAIAHGAEVPFLRDSKADDYSPISEATKYALKQCEEYYKEEYQSIVQLMANCPIRNSQNILEQLEAFQADSQKNSLLSAFKYGMFNPFWAHVIREDNTVEKLFNEFDNVRSQDLPNLLCPSGATWISSRTNLLNESTFYSEDYRFHELSWMEAMDIDDYEDFKLAEMVFDNERV